MAFAPIFAANVMLAAILHARSPILAVAAIATFAFSMHAWAGPLTGYIADARAGLPLERLRRRVTRWRGGNPQRHPIGDVRPPMWVAAPAAGGHPAWVTAPATSRETRPAGPAARSDKRLLGPAAGGQKRSAAPAARPDERPLGPAAGEQKRSAAPAARPDDRPPGPAAGEQKRSAGPAARPDERPPGPTAGGQKRSAAPAARPDERPPGPTAGGQKRSAAPAARPDERPPGPAASPDRQPGARQARITGTAVDRDGVEHRLCIARHQVSGGGPVTLAFSDGTVRVWHPATLVAARRYTEGGPPAGSPGQRREAAAALEPLVRDIRRNGNTPLESVIKNHSEDHPEPAVRHAVQAAVLWGLIAAADERDAQRLYALLGEPDPAEAAGIALTITHAGRVWLDGEPHRSAGPGRRARRGPTRIDDDSAGDTRNDTTQINNKPRAAREDTAQINHRPGPARSDTTQINNQPGPTRNDPTQINNQPGPTQSDTTQTNNKPRPAQSDTAQINTQPGPARQHTTQINNQQRGRDWSGTTPDDGRRAGGGRGAATAVDGPVLVALTELLRTPEVWERPGLRPARDTLVAAVTGGHPGTPAVRSAVDQVLTLAGGLVLAVSGTGVYAVLRGFAR